MDIVLSVSGVPIRLTDERWQHIIAEHPELAETRNLVLETITDPDTIYEGDAGAMMAVKRYGSRLFLAIYREVDSSDGFIITAYWARGVRERRVLWRK